MAKIETENTTPALIDVDVVNFYQAGAELGVSKRYPSLDLVRLEHQHFGHVPGRVLEYACGSGTNALHLLECGHQVEAIDAAPGCVEMLRNRVTEFPDLEARLGLTVLDPDADQIPYEDNSFDYVVCLSLLSLLVTPERIGRLLSEFRRVLKPGGKAILDINGPESGFAAHATLIADYCYEYSRSGGTIRCYCPPTGEAFADMVRPHLEVDDIGFSAHKFFSVSEQEFIVCAHKPVS
ncbi:MAG: class I SAM-dependent methyltransferase [Rhizobiaceae bacterium]